LIYSAVSTISHDDCMRNRAFTILWAVWGGRMERQRIVSK
jgi:hypothetical protein